MSKFWWAGCALTLCWVAVPLHCFAAMVGGGHYGMAMRTEPVEPEAVPMMGVLSGTVSDPSGAKIADAAVHVQSNVVERDTTTDDTGRFSVPLPPGNYAVTVDASGFRTYHTNVRLTDRVANASVSVRLEIDAKPEEITVESEHEESTAAAENKSALVFKGEQLKEFSDDDSSFQQEILAMAGRSPEIMVDGFSNGRFPPKNTISEIRINQNPYSAVYDSLGLGRVEIFTKPGTSTLHGEFTSSGTDNVFDSRNPYTTVEPPFHTLNLDGNVSGSFDKRTSFFFGGTYNDLQNNAIVDATDPTLLTSLKEAVAAPQRTQTYSGRLERQMTPHNTFRSRYEFNRVSVNNSGVGQLVLPSEGLNINTTTQTLQLTDTQVIGAKIITEAHFQYVRTRLQQTPASTGATVVVQGVLNGGGGLAQNLIDNQDHYEFQDLVTVEHGAHYMRFGGRYRLLRDANYSRSSFNGQFTFPDLATYALALKGETPAQIFANGGGATQYNLTTGEPSAVVLVGDLGVFAEDEWKVTPNFTLDYGFRFESQTAVPDHADPAPRVGFAWAVGKGPKRKQLFVLRGGFGLFYDRFVSTNILTAIREQSASTQPSYYVQNPDFYQQYLSAPPPVSLLGSVPATLYNIDPHMRTQYEVTAGLTVDRNIGRIGSVSATYFYIRGDHQYLSRNINAPLPGTYNPANPGSGVRPLGGSQNIYQFGSGGIAQNQILSVNLNVRPSKWVSLFAFEFYAPVQDTDAASATSFPTNQYEPSVDYGREASPSQQFFAGTTLKLPFRFRGNLFGSVQNGSPFNITTGTDLNGDTIFNDRAAFATHPTANSVIYKTPFGSFDANPQPGEAIIPVNYGSSPNFYFLVVRLERGFQIGPRPGVPAPAAGALAAKGPVPKPDRPYSLTFSVEAQNVLNHDNPGTPVGVLGSPLFGQSISLNSPLSLGSVSTSANRTVTLQCNFSF